MLRRATCVGVLSTSSRFARQLSTEADSSLRRMTAVHKTTFLSGGPAKSLAPRLNTTNVLLCWCAVRHQRAGTKARNDRDKKPPTTLTREERLSKRMRTKGEKMEREELRNEADRYVREDVPDEFDDDAQAIIKKARRALQKVEDPVGAIEAVEVDIGGPAKKAVAAISTAVKIGPKELELTPLQKSYSSAILTAVSRYDRSLAVRKDGDSQKVRVTIPLMTAESRDALKQEIKGLESELTKKLQNSRRQAIERIKDMGLDDAFIRVLEEDIDRTFRELLQEKMDELQEMSLRVTDLQLDEDEN